MRRLTPTAERTMTRQGRPSAAASGFRTFAVYGSGQLCLLGRPAELTAVAQHAMENDRELAAHGDGGLLVPIRLARCVLQAFGADQRGTRWRMIPAASYR